MSSKSSSSKNESDKTEKEKWEEESVLSKSDNDKESSVAHSQSEEQTDESGNGDEVERVLERKSYSGQLKYLIKWKGYSESRASWLPREELAKKNPKMMDAFDDSHPIKEYKPRQARPKKELQTQISQSSSESDSKAISSNEDNDSAFSVGEIEEQFKKEQKNKRMGIKVRKVRGVGLNGDSSSSVDSQEKRKSKSKIKQQKQFQYQPQPQSQPPQSQQKKHIVETPKTKVKDSQMKPARVTQQEQQIVKKIKGNGEDQIAQLVEMNGSQKAGDIPLKIRYTEVDEKTGRTWCYVKWMPRKNKVQPNDSYTSCSRLKKNYPEIYKAYQNKMNRK